MAFNMTEIESLTHEYFYPKLVDQIYSKDPILAELKRRKKVVDGGKSFVVPIKVDTLNHGTFAPNSTFNVAKKEIANRVELPVRGAYATMTVDHFDQTMNKGKAQILNLVAEKIEDLEEAMRQQLLGMLYDAQDAANEGFIGLQTIIRHDNSYASIDRNLAEHDYWRSEVIEDPNHGTTSASPIVLDYATLRDFYNRVTDGGKDGKNLIFVGDFGVINKIEDILIKQNMIQSRDNGLANLGFENFTLFGKKVYKSSELENHANTNGYGTLYALNFDYLTQYSLEGSDFHMTPFQADRDSMLKSRHLVLQGNFVSTKPKALGQIRHISI